MKRLLFVGANSIIASAVIKKVLLKNKNIKIDVVVRKNFSIRDKRIKIYKFDINKIDNLKINKHYDCIFYAVSPSSKKRFKNKTKDMDYVKTNINGSISFTKFLMNISFKKFIFLSSGIVYGRFNSSPSSELNKFNFFPEDPLNVYAVSKMTSEMIFKNICERKKAKFINCRIFGIFVNTFSASTKNYIINSFVNSALKTKKIYIKGNANSLISYWDLGNLSNCLCWLIFKSNISGIFNLGSQEKISIKLLAKMISSFFDHNIKIIINEKKTKKMLYYPNVKKIKSSFKKYNFLPIKECVSLMLKTVKAYYKIP